MKFQPFQFNSKKSQDVQYQKKRWESEIEGAGAGIAGGYYFASIFFGSFFFANEKK